MTTLSSFLSDNHYPLALSGSALNGPGADFLRARAQESTFMLIGEDHGVGSNLDFASALFQLIRSLGYRNYVTEVGPVSAGHLNRLARQADVRSAFDAFYRQYPFSIPFAWLEEETRLLESVCAASSEDEAPLIGIDQEFVLSPQLHFDTLLRLCDDPAWRSVLSAWLTMEQNANLQMRDGLSPDQLTAFMNRPLPAEWGALRSCFEAANAVDALACMDALQASQQIYMLYKHEEYYDNNNVRAELMRKYLSVAYRRVKAVRPDARFLVKLGANHVARGHSPMGIQDIGNFISELARMEATSSFHLLVLPMSGALNAWLPFLPETFKSHPVDGDYGEGMTHLWNAAPAKNGWNLYDLRPLRHRQRHWSKDAPGFSDLFQRYDAVLFMEDVRPAKLVGD